MGKELNLGCGFIMYVNNCGQVCVEHDNGTSVSKVTYPFSEVKKYLFGEEKPSTLQRIKEECKKKVYVCDNGCSDTGCVLCKITVGENAVPPTRCPYFDHKQGFKLESEIEEGKC